MLPLLLLAASAAASPASTRAASCKCGVQPSNRIVGGVEAKVNEFPWVAGLQIRMEGGEGDFMCGGTLVAAEWIVTAAHCLYKDQQFKQLQSAKDLIFGLGEHDQWAGGETKIPTIKVEGAKIIVNPAWDGLDTKGDIAMIKLAKPVDLTKYTPACLANTGQSFVGNTAWVYGWGNPKFNAEMGNNKLQKLEMKIASNAECVAWSKKTHGITHWELGSNYVCAKSPAPGKDACQGDSGGPLTSAVGGRHVLVGDVNFGDACKGPYSVYGSIAFYRQWIDATMKANGGATMCAN